MFCPNCGNELPERARFCGKCGNDVSSITQQAGNPAPQGAEAGQAGHDGGAAPSPKTSQPLPLKAIAAVAVVAVVAVAIVGVFALGSGRAPSNNAESAPTAAVSAVEAAVRPAIEFGGKQIQALQRPTLIADMNVQADDYTPQTKPYAVDPGLGNVMVPDGMGLSDEMKALLAKNGFGVEVGLSFYEFHEAYERNRYFLIPSFVTTDSLLHSYHLYFAHLLKRTEKGYLSADLATLARAMMDESAAQLSVLSGTEWESAAKRNTAFFAVAAVLLDPTVTPPAQVADIVNAEIASINAAGGIAESVLTGDNEDYSQYKPRGYYEGDEALERYFRAMMWLGRINFTQKDEDLDRSAALMTLAMNEGGSPTSQWVRIYAVTSFFAGSSDDCGFYEYYPLLKEAYGDNVGVDDLAGNTQAWEAFHSMTALMPAPAINSIPVYDTGENANHQEEQKGFRFMGQRFTIDEAAMARLVYSSVGENASGAKRMLPNALDVPAALGSDTALDILREKGETDYKDYEKNLAEVRAYLGNADPTAWNASLYSQWLSTLKPLLAEKGEGYPSFMRSDAWARKNLQTFLGSYAELKHDTVLYAKQMMVEMGGGGADRDDRGYVEPEPAVFARLAALANATSSGLANYGMLSDNDAKNLGLLSEIGQQLHDIAVKELSGTALTDAEYELIRTYGGQIEHFWEEAHKDDFNGTAKTTREFPSALVTDIATDPNGQVLEVGTGNPSMIWVVVPVDGQLRLARGAVFSFYQFEQPISQRLTDTEWRQMMGIELDASGKYGKPQKHVEDWTLSFQYER